LKPAKDSGSCNRSCGSATEANSVYQAANAETARLLKEGFIKRWQKKFPTAVACFEEDFEACIAHLIFPITHRRAIRSTNPHGA
jgi:transposase-like protein